MALRTFGRALPSIFALMALPASAVAGSEKDADPHAGLTIELESVLTSDYIYRGVSLSARKPSGGGAIDVEYNGFYFRTDLQSVELPTQPAAEFTLSSGYRWLAGKTEFDLGGSYFYYPGEVPTDTATKTNYWEFSLQAQRLFEYPGQRDTGVAFGGNVAYSPDVSATGAWGAYVEGEVAVDLPTLNLPSLNLPTPIDWQLIASAGYWRFGNTSPAQGGLALPSYANWRVALEFALNEIATLSLNYYDTSLSRESCFVFTGDPMATPGGAMNPISNPDGLRSRLCGAAFVATLSVTLEPTK